MYLVVGIFDKRGDGLVYMGKKGKEGLTIG
jgi:hypothetical protein